jgi:hypothetical protein
VAQGLKRDVFVEKGQRFSDRLHSALYWTFAVGSIPDLRNARLIVTDALLLVGRHRGAGQPRLGGLAHFLRMRITILLAISVLCLSMIDGLATLRLIAAGLEEANPVMQFVMASGPGYFLAVKLGMTAIGMMVLVAARRRTLLGTRIRSPHVLVAIAALYALLIAYELALWLMIEL